MNWKLGIVEVGVIPGLPLSLYLPDAWPDETIDPPCYSYIASDGERTVIVDTGPDRYESQAAGLEIVGNTAELLVAGLRAWGVESTDVDCVVHTHLHYDHAQNDLRFPNAAVLVQQVEIDWATGPDCDRFYVGARELVTALGDRLHGIDGDAELLPGLQVVLNAGHTPGHQSVILETTEDVVCVCGDIVSLYANLDTVGRICPNADETLNFLNRARDANWLMLPSHDPKLRNHRWYVQPGSDHVSTSSESG
jgi:glyoxylase-like metal-dependent hydrolase (beta-lactamase superfamily II)